MRLSPTTITQDTNENPLTEGFLEEEEYEWLSPGFCGACKCPRHRNLMCKDFGCMCLNHEPVRRGVRGTPVVEKREKRNNKVCFTWIKGLHCRRGNHCKFAHPLSKEKNMRQNNNKKRIDGGKGDCKSTHNGCRGEDKSKNNSYWGRNEKRSQGSWVKDDTFDVGWGNENNVTW